MQLTDLSPASGLLDGAADVRAIGWLGLESVLVQPTHAISERQFDKLMALSENPWQPWNTAGHHRCEFCRFSGGPGLVIAGDRQVAIGTRTLFIPGTDVIYAAPTTVVHYIDAHGYTPPAEFLNAVDDCPEMRSVPYLRRLMKLGVRTHGRSDRA